MTSKITDSPINIDGTNIKTIESGGSNFFIISRKDNTMPGFYEVILKNEICPLLLPMRFIKEGNIIYDYYDCGGYIQLSKAIKIWQQNRKNMAIELIGVLISVIKIVLTVEDYLFSPTGFRLNADSIFVRTCSGQVKLAYIPEKNEELLAGSIAILIKGIEEITEDEQWRAYADEILENVLSAEDTAFAIIKKLIAKGKEISAKGWPDKNELRTAE